MLKDYNFTGYLHGTLEKYGYPPKEGLRNNKVLVFKKLGN